MASIVAKKEEEKKRESHKQSLLKVPSLTGCARVCARVHMLTAPTLASQPEKHFPDLIKLAFLSVEFFYK